MHHQHSAADVNHYSALVRAAKSGLVPDELPNAVELASGITTHMPRRVILHAWQTIQGAWLLQEAPAQVAIITRCLEDLAALQAWFDFYQVYEVQ